MAQPASARQPPQQFGAGGRWIAPLTPSSSARRLLAVLTMASTSWPVTVAQHGFERGIARQDRQQRRHRIAGHVHDQVPQLIALPDRVEVLRVEVSPLASGWLSMRAEVAMKPVVLARTSLRRCRDRSNCRCRNKQSSSMNAATCRPCPQARTPSRSPAASSREMRSPGIRDRHRCPHGRRTLAAWAPARRPRHTETPMPVEDVRGRPVGSPQRHAEQARRQLSLRRRR